MAVFLWPHPLHRKNSVITPVKCWWIGDVKPSVSSSDGHQYFVSDSNDWTDEPTLYMYDVWPWHKNISSYVYIYIYTYTDTYINIYIIMDVLTQLGLIQTATGSDCPLLQSCGGSKTDRLRCHDLARDIWWWKWGKGWTVCNNLGCLEIQTFPSGAYAFGETTGLCVMRQALLWPCGILICKKGCSHTWPICITTAAFSI